MLRTTTVGLTRVKRSSRLGLWAWAAGLKVKVPKYREEERGVLQALAPHTAIGIFHQIGREL